MSVLQGSLILVLGVLGYLDLRFRQVPVWTVLVLGLIGIVIAYSHMLLSLLSAALLALFMLVLNKRVGAADKWVFPILALALPVTAWLLVLMTYVFAYAHVKWFQTHAPMLFYMCVALLIYLVTGGKWL
ncbi:hypothetical protein ACFQZE_23935 [Paenibacillus sp. GCM10027627]|uniref:hypothetical protein n=1 Tax=unclassified Paenibacillus TaxID=185978 RepID=UPI0036262CBC